MANTAKLRKLDTSKVLTPGELEVLNKNFFDIEAALNSIGAATPGSTPSIPSSLIDLTNYLYLLGKVGGQTLSGIGLAAGLTITQTDLSDVTPLFKINLAGSTTLIEVRGHGPATTPVLTVSNNFSTSSPAFLLNGVWKHASSGGDYTISPNSGNIIVSSSVAPWDWGFVQHSAARFACGSSPTSSVLTANSLVVVGTTLTSTTLADGRITVTNAITTSGFSLKAGDVTLGFGGLDALLNIHAISGTTITSTGNFDNVALFIRHHTTGTHTADITQWRNPANTVTLAKVDASGNITANSFIGPIAITSLTTRGDLLTRDATTQIRLGIGGAATFLSSNGTDPSWRALLETDITDGTLLARVAGNETITGSWIFSNAIVFNSNLGVFQFNADYSGVAAFYLHDTATGFDLQFGVNSNITAAATINFPFDGGDVVTTLSTNQVIGGAKVFAVDTVLRSSTISVGTRFQDTTTTTKRLRFILSALSASVESAIKVTSTAARTWNFPDYEGDVVIVGNQAAAAGKLGKSTLTAQTGNIAAVTLLTSSANSSGKFRITFYLKTTTAGTPAVAQVKVTVAFNDGSAQTVDVPLEPIAAAAPVLNQNHDLGTLNAASSGEVIVYSAASNAITFTTTGTYTGAPQYTLRGDIERLG